jgi:hypothetical protein
MRAAVFTAGALVSSTAVLREAARLAAEADVAHRRLGGMTVPADVHGPVLGPYYYADPATGHTFYDSSYGYNRADGSSLPDVDLGRLGSVVTPTAVAQVALDLFSRAVVADEPQTRSRLMEQFGDLAGVLARRAEVRTSADGVRFAVWPFEAANPWFPFSGPGWVSGLTSGVGLSVLLRGHQASGLQRLLELSDLALAGFLVPVEQGGPACHGEGGTFFEEVPSSPCTHVLNGHVFALFGLYDHHRVTGSALARTLFDAGVSALKARLPDYAGRFWSRYDSRRCSWSGPAPPFYQLLHAVQFRALARVTGDDTFEVVAGDWQRQFSSRAGRAACGIGRLWHRARRRLVRHRFGPPGPAGAARAEAVEAWVGPATAVP